jgi:lipoprotein signal peptidase
MNKNFILVSTISLWVLFIDWSIKLAQPLLWGGWVPHYVDRVIWPLPIMGLCLFVLVAILDTRLISIAVGLAWGGYCANMFDMKWDGVVWNMIPIPGTDDYWMNVADLCIIGGLIIAFFAIAAYIYKQTFTIGA